MIMLKAAKGCSIVPRNHKFYLTNSNRARQHSQPETSSFRDLLQGRSAALNGNLTTGTHASYNKPDATIQSQLSSRNNPVATIHSQQSSRNNPVATIQSQGAKPKAGRLLTTGTRRNPRNAAFQLTRRCRVAPSTGSSIPQLVTQSQYKSSRDWFFNSSTGHSLTSAMTARRNTSATTDFPFPPAASYSNHQIPNPTSRWLQYG
ncbi:hypothetical protein F511_34611 [Dorcoceras hygrometricum]|uniref:Uncharacterized protein n=1 Tax=Dorcoceras hygrometricum TaxID=472368 RepID=A0A2Z7ANY6_9LAMI|nr:hypothetical protein F511_34611 [Dorcoceras hygrometricum]